MQNEDISHNRSNSNQNPQSRKLQDNRTQSIFGTIRSLSRLLIGGIGLGIEEFNSKLIRWEEIYTQPKIEPLTAEEIPIYEDLTIVNYEEEEIHSSDQIKYALIGILFDTQDQISHSYRTFNRASKMFERALRPIFRPFERNWLLPPIQRKYSKFIDRGEIEVNKWVAIGRAEYSRSRALAQIAVEDTTEDVISELATNPEVNKLVQSQSVGLAEEVIDEVRERTVSADALLDNIVRSMIGRKPRAEIPPPPNEITKRGRKPQKSKEMD